MGIEMIIIIIITITITTIITIITITIMVIIISLQLDKQLDSKQVHKKNYDDYSYSLNVWQ